MQRKEGKVGWGRETERARETEKKRGREKERNRKKSTLCENKGKTERVCWRIH